MTVWIEVDLCSGCGRCARECPYDAVEVLEGKAHINRRCTSCGVCLEACGEEAVRTDYWPKAPPDFSDRKGVWVLAEQREGKLHRVSLELLGKARELASVLGEEVCALLLGHNVASQAKTLLEYGSDKVYLAESESLRFYRTNAYLKIIEELVNSERPGIFLIGATHLGRDLAPRLARRLGTGLTADCTELSLHPEEQILLQTRPAFGGNVIATITNQYSRPQMATVRPGVMCACKIPGHKGSVVNCTVSLDEEEIGVKILEVVGERKRRVNLSEAKVIVAAGRGVGDRGGFGLIEELAAALGAQVAGTRVTVENGWLEAERQVGQTGQSVRPELYIACGISGAVQHRAGMFHSRYVAAINTDPRAPIFEIADWGIVGDLHKVIPELIAGLKLICPV